MSTFIHTQARQAAQKAVDEAIEKYGADNAAFRYCGFAWATIKPARGPFVNFLKQQRIGSNGTYGGWRIPTFDMFTLPPSLSQSMELKEIGAQAYCSRLQELGVKAYAGSRAD